MFEGLASIYLRNETLESEVKELWRDKENTSQYVSFLRNENDRLNAVNIELQNRLVKTENALTEALQCSNRSLKKLDSLKETTQKAEESAKKLAATCEALVSQNRELQKHGEKLAENSTYWFKKFEEVNTQIARGDFIKMMPDS